MSPTDGQETSRFLLIRPARIASNAETAATNAFQRELPGLAPRVLLERARAEFDGLVAALRAAQLEPFVVEGTPEPPAPDAHFPNNWISFHGDGTAVLHAMQSPSRRCEVRPELIDELERRTGLRWPRRVDLTGGVERGAFLEGTGSVVLDRASRVAYACLSARTTRAGVESFAGALDYEPVLFHAVDRAGRPIYHTNVLLALGARFAVLCVEAIGDRDERERLVARLRAGGRELLAITHAQMESFAANLLAARSSAGDPRIVLSERAFAALGDRGRRFLRGHGTPVHAPLDTIEALGGGSARCLLVELFGRSADDSADA